MKHEKTLEFLNSTTAPNENWMGRSEGIKFALHTLWLAITHPVIRVTFNK